MGSGHDLGKGQAGTVSGDITLEGRLSGASSRFPGQHGLGEEGHLEKGDPGQARGAAWQAGPGQEHLEGHTGACSSTSNRSHGAGSGPERRRVNTSPCSPWPRCPASSTSGLEGAWPRGAPGPVAPLLWHVASAASLRASSLEGHIQEVQALSVGVSVARPFFPLFMRVLGVLC